MLRKTPSLRYLIPVLLIVGAVAVSHCRADGRAEAKAIIDRAIRAMGGETNLSRLKAVTWKSRGTLQYGKSDPIPFTSEWAMQGPDHCRKMRGGATFVLNGNRAWFRKGKSLTAYPEKEIPGWRQEPFLHWMAIRLDLTDKALTLSPLGASRIDGREARGIKVIHSELHDVEYELSFDAETGLLTKLVSKSTKKDSKPEERVFSDYREIGGIMYATKLKWTARYGDDDASQEEERFEIERHDKLDDSTFDQP